MTAHFWIVQANLLHTYKKNEITELTYNNNNCTFLYVVSTGVDRADG